MKNSIVFILLLINIVVFGQSVPNTTTFTLQDVVDAVNPTTDDLRDCLKDAVTLYYDPSYNNSSYAPDSSLLRFRNYALTYGCGSTVHAGSASYPSYYRISLGTSINNVDIPFDTNFKPDLILVKFNGSIVYYSNYRGDLIYDYGGTNRSDFTSSLTGRTDPFYGSTFPDTTHYPEDGYPRVYNPTEDTGSFYKNSAITLCDLYIYAPMTGTDWSVEVHCPG